MEYGVVCKLPQSPKTELENLSSMAFHMLRRGRAVSPYVACPHDPAPSAGSWGGLSGAPGSEWRIAKALEAKFIDPKVRACGSV